MRLDLYEDLYKKEDNYWWFCGRRMFVESLLQLLERSHLSPFVPLNGTLGAVRPRPLAGSFLAGATSMEMKILDAGCGTGRQMEELKKYGTVFGFDISDEALKFCQQRGLQNIVKADLNQVLPYPSESFDLITALDVLEHIENDQFALSELKRVLKIGGHLIITVPAHPFLWSYWDESIHHQRRYTKKELGEKLEKAGFNIIRLSYVHFLIFFPTIIIRWLRGLFFGKREKTTSDFIRLPAFLNKFMIKSYEAENFFFKRIDLPIGLSLVALVKP